eukprot:TRINITY_DN24152_c0_g1_i1.p1 TRINITY_DN24152_c0_g1~~TRINITY_DN24152_c0_g1_i1.p1  ORF type:complete len:238 (+),score=19.12 TRINITY_DN24152_c0_g1_i1:65-778(+)
MCIRDSYTSLQHCNFQQSSRTSSSIQICCNKRKQIIQAQQIIILITGFSFFFGMSSSYVPPSLYERSNTGSLHSKPKANPQEYHQFRVDSKIPRAVCWVVLVLCILGLVNLTINFQIKNGGYAVQLPGIFRALPFCLYIFTMWKMIKGLQEVEDLTLHQATKLLLIAYGSLVILSIVFLILIFSILEGPNASSVRSTLTLHAGFYLVVTGAWTGYLYYIAAKFRNWARRIRGIAGPF